MDTTQKGNLRDNYITKMMNRIKRIWMDREIYDYILWGILAAGLNIGLFQVLVMVRLDYRVGNTITLITVKIFCYVTNKLCVFHTKCNNKKELIKEMLTFFSARMATLFLDYFMVVFLIEIIRLDLLTGKMISASIVIVMNFIFSKKVFYRTKEKNISDER